MPILMGVSPLALMMKGDVICAAAMTAPDFKRVRRSTDQRRREIGMRSSRKVTVSCWTAFLRCLWAASVTIRSGFANRGPCNLRRMDRKKGVNERLAGGGLRFPRDRAGN